MHRSNLIFRVCLTDFLAGVFITNGASRDPTTQRSSRFACLRLVRAAAFAWTWTPPLIR